MNHCKKKDINYSSVEVSWMDNGKEVLIAAKKILMIPTFSTIEKKMVVVDNGISTSIFMYSFSLKDAKLTPWPEEKIKKNLRYSSIAISPNNKCFVAYNNRIEDSSSYGEAMLFTISDEKIHEITRLSFGEFFSSVKFDQSGRYFVVESARMHMGSTISKGYKMFYFSGEVVCEVNTDVLREVMWRPRHKPIKNLYEEYGSLTLDKPRLAKLNEELQTEEDEFLSDFDKEKKKKYDGGKQRLYAIVNRRREAWDNSGEERKKLAKIEVDKKEIAFTFSKEEILVLRETETEDIAE